MSNRIEFRDYSSLEASSRAIADTLVNEIQKARDENKAFTLVLAGGKTPETLYRMLLQPPYQNTIPWEIVHVFVGDERFVPDSHPDSNYAMMHQSLLSTLPLPASQIHPIPTHFDTPEKAAASYEQNLQNLFLNLQTPGSIAGGTTISFDVILLGMGSDGHTASLFPGSQALE
ncbi:6-phosphogluconolactonase, partial [Thermodesulfobacteriota bacterium]